MKLLLFLLGSQSSRFFNFKTGYLGDKHQLWIVILGHMSVLLLSKFILGETLVATIRYFSFNDSERGFSDSN